MTWNNAAKVIVPFTFLLTALWLLDATALDFSIQKLFFSSDTSSWLVEKYAPLPKLIFYDGIKVLIIAFAIGILAYQIYLSRVGDDNKHLDIRLRGLRIVLLSLILIPTTVGILKNITNIACPADLIDFGGDVQHVSLLDSHAANGQTQAKQYRCFPAGHASGGFALMSLYYLGFASPKRRKVALAVGICLGWIMGGYKMLIGDHFFSHTLTTMILAWIIIQLIVITYDRMVLAK